MAMIGVGYLLAHDGEELAVMNLFLFPHMSLEMRVIGMAFEEGVESLEVAIEMGIGMVEVIYKIVITMMIILEVMVVTL